MKKFKKIKAIIICLILILVGGCLYKIDFNIKGNLDNFFDFIKENVIIKNELSALDDSGVVFDNYDFDPVFYPYYGMLDKKEKNVYKQVYANAYVGEDTFVLKEKVRVEEVDKIIEYVYNDHPELFWLNTNYSYRYTTDGYCAQIILSFNKLFVDLDYNKAVFERNAKVIINKANTFKTVYEKEKYVHDTIIEMNEYELDAEFSQSAYSAIVNNKTVCAGFSKAFQHIMIELGIPAYYVSGVADGDHAWNIIKLDNDYYNVDLTWAAQEDIIYNFFNVSDDFLNSTHTRSEVSNLLPVCNGGKYGNLEKVYPITPVVN